MTTKDEKMPRATIDDANSSAQKASNSIDRVVDNMDYKVSRANQIMNAQVTKLVRKMLLQNYNSSGVKTRTGKLVGALSQVEAIVQLKGNSPKVTIYMPAGISNYENGGNFYKASAAVNYGSVRGSTEGSAKRKRKIKNKLLKNASKKNPSDTVITQGHILSGGTKTKSGSLKFSGGVTVTKPHNFWELSASQQSEVQDLILEIFNREVFGTN